MKISCLALSIAVSAAGVIPAMSAGPSAEYKIKEEQTIKSPDGTTTVEQYAKTDEDGLLVWQFWARRSDTSTLLKPEQKYYSAGFRFTRDARWLVREQKTASGQGTMFLYKLGPNGFVAATSKPLADLAWAFFYSRPESRKVTKPDFHINTRLLDPVDDGKERSGDESWPDNRYLVLTLEGEVMPTRKHGQLFTVRDWHCRYDLETGKFDVPEAFAKDNAAALAPQ
jgi:hypothetical protein